MIITQGYLSVFFLLIFVIIALFAFRYLKRVQKENEITHSLNMALLLVTVPLYKNKDAKAEEEVKRLIGVMEQFYSSLSISGNKKGWVNAVFSGNSAIAFEMSIHIVGDEVHFYMSVPKKYTDSVEKQITALLGDARVDFVEDYNLFNPNGVTRGSFLKLSHSFFLPIKTYKELESDPLNAIINAMSSLQFEGEGSTIQILVRPNNLWQKTAKKILMEMRGGKTFSQAHSNATKGFLGSLLELFQKKENKKPEEDNIQKVLDETTIKALERKISKIGFEVNVRLLSSAYTETRANAILSDLENAFLQFENPGINGFKAVRVLNNKLNKLIYNFSFRIFNPKNKILLNTEELSSIFHFPTPYLENQKIRSIKSKTAPAPTGLPQSGLFLGINIHRGNETPVRILDEDRLRHFYILGQTGTGKSVALKNMIQQDIENGEGVCFVDPHGEDLEDILTRIPQNRMDDVIVFDPSDLQRPLGINMLEYNPKKPEQKTFIINEIITIFDKLYDLKATGGPMFEQYLRNALLLLMSDPESGSTLLEVPRIFSDPAFRKMKLSKTNDILVKNFWETEAAKAGGEASLNNITPYITSKFNVFLANEFVRPIISQQKSSIDFRKIMDEKKIFLVNLSKGKIGDINSSLLGLVIVGKLTMAALSRGDESKEERTPFYLYIDEFHNFATESISVILSEARKYKLALIMAHQFIAQLPEKIRDAIFGNVGSMMVFRLGTDDADFMEKQFSPVFSSSDIMNLDNLNAYLKILVNNQTKTPFNIIIDFPKKGSFQVAEKVKELSSVKYGKPKQEIEKEIEKRYEKEGIKDVIKQKFNRRSTDPK